MTLGQSQGFTRNITSPDDEARRVLDYALDAGINTIDTANVYSEGRSEQLLGEWLGGKRANVVLATKCRFATNAGIAGAKIGPHDQGLSRRAIIQACEDSLRRLKTDWIDLYQVHSQDTSVPIDETLRALDDLVSTGKVRYVGCSNYTGVRLVESLWAADTCRIKSYSAIQLQWSLLVRDSERELIPAARLFGLGTLVWGPLAGGFLSGKYICGTPPPDGSRLSIRRNAWNRMDTPHNWRVLDAVRVVAESHSTSTAAVALAWLLAKPETSSVIVGARTVQQLVENLACLSVELSPQVVSKLDNVSAPEWGYPYTWIGDRW